MARNYTRRPLTVTGLLSDGTAVPGLVINDVADIAAFLLDGSRITDGQVAQAGWVDLICSECGDSAAWCPDLEAGLPATWVARHRAW